MLALLLLANASQEWLILSLRGINGVVPTVTNGVHLNALLAAFFTAHREADIQFAQIPVGYDGCPIGLLHDQEFIRSSSMQKLKQNKPEAWFIRTLFPEDRSA